MPDTQEMKEIVFLENCTVQDGSGTRFKKGKTYILPLASANRWIKRAKAVDASEAPDLTLQTEKDNSTTPQTKSEKDAPAPARADRSGPGTVSTSVAAKDDSATPQAESDKDDSTTTQGPLRKHAAAVMADCDSDKKSE